MRTFYNLEDGTKGWIKQGYAVESVWATVVHKARVF